MSTWYRGVQRISRDPADSTIGLRADMPACNNGSAPKFAPPNRSASFTLQYSSIRGRNSILSPVEQHLGSILLNLLLLFETQLSIHAFADPFKIFHYNLYARFRSKGGVCAYSNTVIGQFALRSFATRQLAIGQFTVILPQGYFA
ncbi:hypothetical protein SK128_000212, partial [Halocaridina rubra]